MANINELEQYEAGIYQIETTDPVMGGPDGISNKAAKQLANRTKYLKKRADEVDQAKGTFGSLDERLDGYDQFDPEAQNALAMVSVEALAQAGLAHRELKRLQEVKTQRGIAVLSNRGIINGCVVTKSSTATRNLSLAKGTCFYGSRLVPARQADNVAVIPSNLTGLAGSCWCYLIENAGLMNMVCTEIGGALPENGLLLYKINVPAGNTAENDPQGTAVTLTDMRRIEAGYPTYFINAPFALIALQYAFLDADYSVSLEVVDFTGGGFQEGDVYVGDRAANGFKIYMNGTIDKVKVRWIVTRREN